MRVRGLVDASETRQHMKESSRTTKKLTFCGQFFAVLRGCVDGVENDRPALSLCGAEVTSRSPRQWLPESQRISQIAREMSAGRGDVVGADLEGGGGGRAVRRPEWSVLAVGAAGWCVLQPE